MASFNLSNNLWSHRKIIRVIEVING